MAMSSNRMNRYSWVEFNHENDFNPIVNSFSNDIFEDRNGKGGNLRKGPWSPAEDKLLGKFVAENGEGEWKRIAKVLHRTHKSCRLRWCNQLNPKINHAPFTAAEDKIIVGMVKKGGGWSQIARMLKCRTDNQVKNRWHSRLRKLNGRLRKENPNREYTQTETQKAKAADGNIKGRHSFVSNSISASLPTSGSTSPCRFSSFHLADGSINPYIPSAFVASDPFVNQIYPPDFVYPAPSPTFNPLISLNMCLPGHEMDDVHYNCLFPNPPGLYPSTLRHQPYAPVGIFTAMMCEAISSEPEQQTCVSGMSGFSLPQY